MRRPSDLDDLATWLGPLVDVPGIDAVSVHVYPDAGRLADAPALLAAAKARVDELGFAARPAWLTELNVQDGSTLSPDQQARAVGELTTSAQQAGFTRAYWYAWTDLGPEGLIRLAPGTVGAAALAEESSAS